MTSHKCNKIKLIILFSKFLKKEFYKCIMRDAQYNQKNIICLQKMVKWNQSATCMMLSYSINNQSNVNFLNKK